MRGRLRALLLAARTIRHLRPEQMVARAAFLAERRLVAARPGALVRRYTGRLEGVEATATDAGPLWEWPPAPFDPASRADLDRARQVIRGRFTFLNQPRRLFEPINWSPPDTSRLWRFQLHGFAYAVDLAVAHRHGEPGAYDRFRSLVRQWLAANPPGGGDAWHPFVVSGRLIGWQVARDLLRRELANDPALSAELARALLLHAEYLSRHLEWDVGGNHLLKNAVALLHVGCGFEGPAAERWRAQAGQVLESQLCRQVLPDGGHYERSPMYQLLVLADLLVALRAAGRRELPVAVPLADAVRRMQTYARALRHPDGEIPLFNDAVLGEAPPPAALIGPRTSSAGDALHASGYFLLRLASPPPGGVLVVDAGPPGPDDLPAHVHADALSFELSVGDRRCLVDGGVLDYEPGPMRSYFRGTVAHNTVQVDGLDQSEVWDRFRVGRRATVRLTRWQVAPQHAVFAGWHDGYRRQHAWHEREIQAVEGRGWRIVDTIHGAGSHHLVARLRLHPQLRWEARGGEFAAVARDGAVLLRARPFGATRVSVERGVYAARFNRPRDVEVLALQREGSLPAVFGCWLLLADGEPAVT